MNKPSNKLPTALDIATHIDRIQHPDGIWQLHRLLYYCQAWSLAWGDGPIFSDRIEAWVSGPAIPSLYEWKREESEPVYFALQGWPLLTIPSEHLENIRAVLKLYGGMGDQQLRDIACQERPWQAARLGIPIHERGSVEITHESMRAYYRELWLREERPASLTGMGMGIGATNADD